MNMETFTVTKNQLDAVLWQCIRCKSIQANHVKWGDMSWEQMIAG